MAQQQNLVDACSCQSPGSRYCEQHPYAKAPQPGSPREAEVLAVQAREAAEDDLLKELDMGYETYGWTLCGRAAAEIRRLRALVRHD